MIEETAGATSQKSKRVATPSNKVRDRSSSPITAIARTHKKKAVKPNGNHMKGTVSSNSAGLKKNHHKKEKSSNADSSIDNDEYQIDVFDFTKPIDIQTDTCAFCRQVVHSYYVYKNMLL